VEHLKNRIADRQVINDLNRLFGNVREVVTTSQVELLEPAIDRMRQEAGRNRLRRRNGVRTMCGPLGTIEEFFSELLHRESVTWQSVDYVRLSVQSQIAT